MRRPVRFAGSERRISAHPVASSAWPGVNEMHAQEIASPDVRSIAPEEVEASPDELWFDLLRKLWR